MANLVPPIYSVRAYPAVRDSVPTYDNRKLGSGSADMEQEKAALAFEVRKHDWGIWLYPQSLQ